MDVTANEEEEIAEVVEEAGHVQPIEEQQVEQVTPAKTAPAKKARAPTNRSKKQPEQVEPAITISANDEGADVTAQPTAEQGDDPLAAALDSVERGSAEQQPPSETAENAKLDEAVEPVRQETTTEQIDTTTTPTLADALGRTESGAALKSFAPASFSGANLFKEHELPAAQQGLLDTSKAIRKTTAEQLERGKQRMQEMKAFHVDSATKLTHAMEKLAKWNKRFRALEK